MNIFRRQNLIRLCSSVLFGLMIVSAAQACSVCVVGKEEARTAYYATTAIMSFLPLIMIGGIVYFIIKKYR